MWICSGTSSPFVQRPPTKSPSSLVTGESRMATATWTAMALTHSRWSTQQETPSTASSITRWVLWLKCCDKPELKSQRLVKVCYIYIVWLPTSSLPSPSSPTSLSLCVLLFPSPLLPSSSSSSSSCFSSSFSSSSSCYSSFCSSFLHLAHPSPFPSPPYLLLTLQLLSLHSLFHFSLTD